MTEINENETSEQDQAMLAYRIQKAKELIKRSGLDPDALEKELPWAPTAIAALEEEFQDYYEKMRQNLMGDTEELQLVRALPGQQLLGALVERKRYFRNGRGGIETRRVLYTHKGGQSDWEQSGDWKVNDMYDSRRNLPENDFDDFDLTEADGSSSATLKHRSGRYPEAVVKL